MFNIWQCDDVSLSVLYGFLVHFTILSLSLSLFPLTSFLLKKLAYLSYRVFLRLDFADNIPCAFLTCFFLFCNFCKLLVESGSLIRFKFDFFNTTS